MKALLWPFAIVWRLTLNVVRLTGRLVAVLLGMGFIVLGGVLTLTVVGAPIGIPLIVAGLLLIARGLF